MNVIVVISDTFRRDHLGCYGSEWIQTPNLDRFAGESVVFDRAYAASFPTVPNRRDVLTGRFTFTYSDWAPLPPDETVLPEVLRQAGYVTMMILDTPHIVAHGFNFQRGFDGWHWIRGQENDTWRTSPRDPELPCAPAKLRLPETTVKQYLRNVAKRRSEADYFVAQTMASAARWLDENAGAQPFFLYVDTFDPHEPWDPPQRYVDLYDPGYEGEEVIYPQYAPCDFLTGSELKHVRALYAGEVTLVDAWFGKLLDRVDERGLRDDTMVVFTTDHGFYHGEHGLIGKSILAGDHYASVPLYEEVAHIPLVVRYPAVEPGRRSAYAQPPDLMPTILEMAGVEIPDTVQGRSLAPALRGERDETRPIALTSPSIIHGPRARQFTTITGGEWSLIYPGAELSPDDRAESRTVDSITRVHSDLYAGAGAPELYHIPTDSGQTGNVFAENRDIAEQLHREHVEFLEELGTREEHLANRRGLTEG
jgi:arylsulfatase A-like enzyme